MEEAYQIFSYLPLRYKSNEEDEYIQYLWKAFVNNYQNEQYQFAFMSYHMLFMCFVYFTIWKIKSIQPDDYSKVLLGFHTCLETATSPFGFSEEQERKIMRIFRFWNITSQQLKTYKELIDDRNNIAHANGNIFYKDEQSIDEKISDMLKACEEIQAKTKDTIEQSYVNFLSDNYSLDDSPYSTVEEMLNEEYTQKFYISKKDISICCNYNIVKLSKRINYESIHNIHHDIMELNKEE